MDRVKRYFADQFEPADEGYVYRRSLKGAPILVSEGEYQDFVRIYARQMRILPWVIAVAIMATIIAGLLLFPDMMAGHSGLVSGILSVPCLVATFGVHHWFWNRPMRMLAGRKAVGIARSRDEVRRLRMARISYRQLAVAPVFVGFVLWRAFERFHQSPGVGRLLVVLGVAASLFALVQAFRKWSIEQER